MGGLPLGGGTEIGVGMGMGRIEVGGMGCDDGCEGAASAMLINVG